MLLSFDCAVCDIAACHLADTREFQDEVGGDSFFQASVEVWMASDLKLQQDAALNSFICAGRRQEASCRTIFSPSEICVALQFFSSIAKISVPASDMHTWVCQQHNYARTFTEEDVPRRSS